MMKKRILSFLLALLMAGSLLPTGALAAENPELPAMEESVAVPEMPLEEVVPTAPDVQEETAVAEEVALLAANSPLPDYTGDWVNFRGNDWNMGITAAQTPMNSNEAETKWAMKYGTGYTAAPTPPILVNGDLYLVADGTVRRISKATGEVLAASEPLAGAAAFSMNPITYGGGLLYVLSTNGRVQALRADTLESVWVSEELGGQANTPVTYRNGYIYTGTWNNETKNGTYFCLNVTDENPNSTAEIKNCTWKQEHLGGFYWAGAYATDKYVVFGSDDGTAEGSPSDNGTLYSVSPTTGKILDTITGIRGDIRTSIAYDKTSDALYCTTKGGLFIKVRINPNGTFDKSTYKTLDLGAASTGTPLVHNGVAFVGISGPSRFGKDGHTFKAIDVDKMAIIGSIPIQGYVQSSSLLSTAHEAEGKLYIYITYNARPGGIDVLEYDISTKKGTCTPLFIPEKSQQNCCLCSLVADSDGTIYYKNDSGYLFAIASTPAYLTGLTASVGTGLAGFVPGTTAYEVVVPAKTAAVTFSATACPGGTVTVNGTDNPTVTLTKGSGTAQIAVKKGESTRTYTVTIREAKAVATLSALRVNESNGYSSFKTLTPEFASDTTAYATFGLDTTTFTRVWPDVTDPNATVKVFALSNIDPDHIQSDGTISLADTISGHKRSNVYYANPEQPAVLRIEVTAEDGKAVQSYKVLLTKGAATAKSYATELALDHPTLKLTAPDQTAQLIATTPPQSLLGSGEAETLTWSSSNDTVATVDQTGLVTCKSGGTAVIAATGALTSASCAVTSALEIQVTVSAYDYNAVWAKLPGASIAGVVMEQQVTVQGGTSAADAVKAAFAAANVPATWSGDYVSAIGGLGAAGGMSGWMLAYNNDDFTNFGLATLTLASGDRLDFHYSANVDGKTDDIGNGFYGLPILTSFTLGGRTVTMSKQSVTDANWNTTTTYYIHGNQGTKVALQGKGTQTEPFLLPITLPDGTDLSALTASYTASLSAHYAVFTGLNGPGDYRNPHTVTVASLGGTHKTWYKVTAAKEPGSVNPPTDTISVSFRLIGATISETDVDMGKGTGKSEYQNWLKTRSYTLPKGATVYDLFTGALDSAGLRYVGAENNYISAIYAPAGYGGYALSEFTNGSRSGWMYSVSGTHPTAGLKNRTLHDGDVVVWHYINDYSYEVKDWFGDAQYPTLGDSTTWNLWLKAADVNPPAAGGGSKPEKPAEKPAEKPNGKTETMSPAVTADKNGSAAVTVSKKDADKALEAVKKNGSAELVISPDVKGNAQKVAVTLPKTAVSDLASGTKAALTVESKIAKISLSTGALATIAANQGADVSVTAQRVSTDQMSDENKALVGDHPVYDFSVTVGTEAVQTFGGAVTVTLPYTPKEGEDTRKITVFYIDENGKAAEMTGAKYDPATQSITFETDHFSTFAVAYNEKKAVFTDVNPEDWFFDAVNFATEKGLFSGTTDNTFSPQTDMTRSMLWTVLYRLSGEKAAKNVTDTPQNDSAIWYAEGQKWAISTGISDGLHPDKSVTRQELAAMLYRYTKGTKTVSDLSKFTDADAVAPWAADGINWAVSAGVLTGRTATTLVPEGTAKRCEVAAVLERFVTAISK